MSVARSGKAALRLLHWPKLSDSWSGPGLILRGLVGPGSRSNPARRPGAQRPSPTAGGVAGPKASTAAAQWRMMLLVFFPSPRSAYRRATGNLRTDSDSRPSCQYRPGRALRPARVVQDLGESNARNLRYGLSRPRCDSRFTSPVRTPAGGGGGSSRSGRRSAAAKATASRSCSRRRPRAATPAKRRTPSRTRRGAATSRPRLASAGHAL